jgi:hypothetical protein
VTPNVTPKRDSELTSRKKPQNVIPNVTPKRHHHRHHHPCILYIVEPDLCNCTCRGMAPAATTATISHSERGLCHLRSCCIRLHCGASSHSCTRSAAVEGWHRQALTALSAFSRISRLLHTSVCDCCRPLQGGWRDRPVQLHQSRAGTGSNLCVHNEAIGREKSFTHCSRQRSKQADHQP